LASLCENYKQMKLYTLVLGLFLQFVVIESQAQELSHQAGFSIVGVGDMMYGTHFPTKAGLPPFNNPWPLVQAVDSVFQTADVVFGNLEGAFLDEGEVYKSCKDTTKCYAFKTPSSYAKVLDQIGFDMVSLANNHIRDFGPPGLKNTRQLLDSMGIAYAGIIDQPYDIIVSNGKKVGLCAFAPNTGTVQIKDLENAKAIVKKLTNECDYVVVSFHGGAEGGKHQHITRQTETFYGENRGNVYEFAHTLIDAGADVVFGHGPHVPRAIEVYKGRFIAYSLGNFCTYSQFNINGPNGLSPVAQVWLDEDGRMVKGKIHPFYQQKGKGVLKDPLKRVIFKMRELTRIDFPELNDRLLFEDDGTFYMVLDQKIPMLPTFEKVQIELDTKSYSLRP